MNLRDIGRPLLWFVIGLAVAAVPLLLHRNQQSGIVVRSYSVAPEIASELKGALMEALPPGIGHVSQTPDGHILVTAPETLQQGVQNIVDEVAAKKPSPTPTIHFEAWLVSAVPAASAPDNEPGLAEVRPALADIQKAKGPLHFELIENLAIQARAGNENSAVQGARAGLEIAPTLRYDAKGEPVIAGCPARRIHRALGSARSPDRGYGRSLRVGYGAQSLAEASALEPCETLFLRRRAARLSRRTDRARGRRRACGRTRRPACRDRAAAGKAPVCASARRVQ